MNDDGFRVETPEQAAWAMRKYRRLAQKRDEYVALAAAERERIAAWEQRVTATVDSEMEFFAGHLEGYALGQRAEGRKSIDLPDGVIKTRQSGMSYDINKEEFVYWAQGAMRDDLLRYTVAPDMTAIKSSVVADGAQVLDPASGEIIPGITPIPERVSVKIEPDLTAVDLDGIEQEGMDDDVDE